VRPAGARHSAWELLEHIRIALEDIARFSGAMESSPPAGQFPKGYAELNWPDDYWPPSPAPASAKQWNQSVQAVRDEMSALKRIVEDPSRDLFAPFPWGDGQTLLREALLVADHNAYHIGQLVLIRQLIE
jgi:hypothetical protein